MNGLFVTFQFPCPMEMERICRDRCAFRKNKQQSLNTEHIASRGNVEMVQFLLNNGAKRDEPPMKIKRQLNTLPHVTVLKLFISSWIEVQTFMYPTVD